MDNRDIATKDSDIFQHLSEAREDKEWRSLGASGTGINGKADTAKEVGLKLDTP